MRPETEYEIDHIEKKGSFKIVHLLRENLIYEYRLQKPYPDLISDEDMNLIDSGKGIFTLKGLIRKYEGELFRHTVVLNRAPVFID